MALFYLDSSALAKRYKEEKGSDVVDFIFERQTRARMATSFIATIELVGVVARLRISRILSEARAAEIISQFRDEIMSDIEVFPVGDLILANAVGLAEHYGLRAADAIHLATITEMARKSTTVRTAFVALIVDKSLKKAAEKEGIVVLNPEDDEALAGIRNIK